jgi:hypothetical protein
MPVKARCVVFQCDDAPRIVAGRSSRATPPPETSSWASGSRSHARALRTVEKDKTEASSRRAAS